MRTALRQSSPTSCPDVLLHPLRKADARREHEGEDQEDAETRADSDHRDTRQKRVRRRRHDQVAVEVDQSHCRDGERDEEQWRERPRAEPHKEVALRAASQPLRPSAATRTASPAAPRDVERRTRSGVQRRGGQPVLATPSLSTGSRFAQPRNAEREDDKAREQAVRKDAITALVQQDRVSRGEEGPATGCQTTTTANARP